MNTICHPVEDQNDMDSAAAPSFDQNKIAVTGSIVKTAKLQSEHFVVLDDPQNVIVELRQSNKADIFTFLQHHSPLVVPPPPP